MSRSSLQRIQGDLDLTRYFKLFQDLAGPESIPTLFDKTAPLELEIGSGKGLFIKRATSQFPNHHFLGIELSYRYALASAAALCRAGVSNGVMVCADGAKILSDFILDNSLEAVHVYFPDPWWKKSHRKRRILRTDVLQLIEKRLRPGGLFHFWTDVEEYYLSTLKIIAAETGLIGPSLVPEPLVLDDGDYQTHFERRTCLNHLPVYRSFFKKQG